MSYKSRNINIYSKANLIIHITRNSCFVKRWVRSAIKQLVNAKTENHFAEMLNEIEIREAQLAVLEEVLEDLEGALKHEVQVAEDEASKRQARRRRNAISTVSYLYSRDVLWPTSNFLKSCIVLRDILFNNVPLTMSSVLMLYKFMRRANR